MADDSTQLSPDGVFRVEYAASEVGPFHWARAPRVVLVDGDRVLLDLWCSSWDASARFADGGAWLELRCYPGDTKGFEVFIDPRASIFAFHDRLDRREPLRSFRARLEERYLDQMIEHAQADARKRRKKKRLQALVERLELLSAWRAGEGFIDDELELAHLFEGENTADDNSFRFLLERIDRAIAGHDE